MPISTFDGCAHLKDEYNIFKEGFNEGWRIGMEFYNGSGMLGKETYNEDFIKEKFDLYKIKTLK